MNQHYRTLAYERSLWGELRRHLEESYLEGGGTQKRKAICESLPYEIREVPNDTVASVIQKIEQEEYRITKEMGLYDFRRRTEGIGELVFEEPEERKPSDADEH
jgi:hypothetical protein